MTVVAGELRLGQVFTEDVVTGLTRSQIVQYAGASDDFNPLHVDEVFATTVAGYSSVVAHGMLTMGLSAKALTDLVGPGRLMRFGGRFLAIVVPGDSLTVVMEVDGVTREGDDVVVELDVTTRNQEGTAVFAGYAEARLPLARRVPS